MSKNLAALYNKTDIDIQFNKVVVNNPPPAYTVSQGGIFYPPQDTPIYEIPDHTDKKQDQINVQDTNGKPILSFFGTSSNTHSLYYNTPSDTNEKQIPGQFSGNTPIYITISGSAGNYSVEASENPGMFGFDIVFNSSSKPIPTNDTTSPPMAMAYGYSFKIDQSTTNLRGEVSKQHIAKGSTISFNLFDQANGTITINYVVISFKKTGNSPTIPKSKKAPFGADSNWPWTKGEMTFMPGPSSGEGYVYLDSSSTVTIGCNMSEVTTYRLGITPGQLAYFIASETGHYECTVWLVITVNGVTKLFRTDPEMDVEAGG